MVTRRRLNYYYYDDFIDFLPIGIVYLTLK